MSRYSPRIRSNAGAVAENTFAAGLEAMEFKRQKDRQEREDERREELYNLQMATRLADAADQGIRRAPPMRQAEAPEIFQGAELGMGKVGGGTRSPLAMGQTPGELAAQIETLEREAPEPRLRIRAGQFVPGQGFAATNIFEDVRLPSMAARAQVPETGWEELGDTGYWRGPQEQGEEGFRYRDNTFGSQDEAIEFARALAQAQYPDRFAEAEGGNEPWEPMTREEQIAFERDRAAARRGPEDEGDPLLTQRSIADRDRVGDVRDAIIERSRFSELEQEEKDRIAQLGGFEDYADFQAVQRSLGIQGAGQTTTPGGVGTEGMATEGAGASYTEDDLDAALDAADGDIDRAMEILMGGGEEERSGPLDSILGFFGIGQ